MEIAVVLAFVAAAGSFGATIVEWLRGRWPGRRRVVRVDVEQPDGTVIRRKLDLGTGALSREETARLAAELLKVESTARPHETELPHGEPSAAAGSGGITVGRLGPAHSPKAATRADAIGSERAFIYGLLALGFVAVFVSADPEAKSAA